MENNKILILTLEYPLQIGGIASYVNDVAENLPKNMVTVLAPFSLAAVNYDKTRSINVIRRKFFLPLVWPKWIRILWHAFFIVKRDNFSVLHIHQVLPLGYVGYFLKFFLKVPYIIFLHGSDFQLALKRPIKKALFNFVCRGAKNIVVNSKFSQDYIINSGVRGSKIIVLHPCPGELFYTYKPSEEKIIGLRSRLALNGKKVLVSAGRLVDRKGFLVLAKYLPKILKYVSNLVWLVIGNGPEEAKLIKLITETNTQSVVRILPAVPREEMINYYYAADVFALLTHRDKDEVEEAWGTAFIEAAACGAPVIAGASGGTTESVIDNKSGLVVNALNELEVINAIIKVLTNKELAKAMGGFAQIRATSEFRWKIQLAKLGL